MVLPKANEAGAPHFGRQARYLGHNIEKSKGILLAVFWLYGVYIGQDISTGFFGLKLVHGAKVKPRNGKKDYLIFHRQALGQVAGLVYVVAATLKTSVNLNPIFEVKWKLIPLLSNPY